jgi:hypothetical protein
MLQICLWACICYGTKSSEFIVNFTTAKSLGLTLSPTLLFQANEVLQ